MHPATVLAALRLQIDDINSILGNPDPVSRPTADEIVAFRTFRAALVRKWSEVNGEWTARILLREENANRAAFARLVNEEWQAVTDHEMACRLAGIAVPPRPRIGPEIGEVAQQRQTAVERPRNAGLNGGKIPLCLPTSSAAPTSSLKRPAVDGPEDFQDKVKKAKIMDPVRKPDSPSPLGLQSESAVPKSSLKRPAVDDAHTDTSSNPKRTKFTDEHQSPALQPSSTQKSLPNNTATHAICSSCLDRHPKQDVLQLRCKGDGELDCHAYCCECLEGLFRSSMTDSSLFPPRCCSQIIQLFACTRFLCKETIVRFVEKRDELSCPNRTYCSNAECAAWIKPENVKADIATCQLCSHKTCTTCKSKQHEGLCPEDRGVKILMNVAKELKWKVCPQCKNMVELGTGCYHITCRCQYQFCYLCLAKWKTCNCNLWDERNIINPLGANVVQAPRGVIIQPPVNVVQAQRRVINQPPVNVIQAQRVIDQPPAHAVQVNVGPHRHSWERQNRTRRVNAQCDHCEAVLDFVNHCVGCQERTCMRCMNHRR